MFDPIEGVDYMVDYYAVLGIGRDSTKRDIELALRNNRSQWHPDRMGNLSPDILKQAEFKNTLFGKAEDVLMDDKFRQAYDERLTNFDSRLVSTEGHAIIDPSKRRVDLDFIISGKDIDFSALIERARQLTGYDEERVKSVETLYNSDKENKTFKDLYRKELVTEFVFVSQLEDMAWARAGIANQKPIRGLLYYPDEYSEQVEIEIERVKAEEIPEGLENRLLAYETGVTPLLSYNGEGDGSYNEISTEVRKRLIGNFSDRCDQIREITIRKQEVLEKLVSLTDYEYLVENDTPTPYCNIFIIDDKKDEVIYGLRFHKEGFTGGPLQKNYNGMPLKDLKNMRINKDTILVHHNPEVTDFLMEATYVTELHFNKSS